MTKSIVVWFGALICCALWGRAFPCIKIGYGMMNIAGDDTASQILYAGYRFTLAGIMAIVIGSLINRKFLYPSKQAVKKVCVLSMFQTILQYLFFYIGLAHTNGTKASIITGMNVFVAIIVSSLLFRLEDLTTKKIIGCIVGFLGVIFVNISSGGIDMNFAFNGEGFIFLSTVSYAFSSVTLKKYSKTENTVMLSGWQFLVGGIVMSIAGLLMGGHLEGFNALAVLMLIYLAFISSVAYSLWSILLTYNPVSRVAVFGFMNPIIGFLLSAILLDEAGTIGIFTLIALILVCAGIYIVNSGNKAEINET
jgi:drug/metabolite transporter (DMT)-like permease